MNKNAIIGQWYTEWYDNRETWGDDVKFFQDLLKSDKKKIFEICCGTGRILLPLAKEGHEMYGIDKDNYMLAKLFEKSEGVDNINIKQDDVLKADWGMDYDVVIMGGNILINIENVHTRDDYIRAQKLLVKKSYDALKSGGYFLMDNDRYKEPEKFFRTTDKPRIKEFDSDSMGISSKITYLWSKYDKDTQVCEGANIISLYDKENNMIIEQERKYIKYIPTLEEQSQWIEDVGFEIINRWSDYNKSSIENDSYRVIHYARKI